MDELWKFKQVNKTKSITELSNAIISIADSDGMLQGDSRKYQAAKMAKSCLKFADGESSPETLTREFGIRQQAMMLKHYGQL